MALLMLPARAINTHSTFNFSVPELSWLAVILLILACLVLHYVPIRVLLLLWGCVKFSRRLLRPHTVPNNEVLDLLSRVPDDDQLVWHYAIFFYFVYVVRHSNGFRLLNESKIDFDFISISIYDRSCTEKSRRTQHQKWHEEIYERREYKANQMQPTKHNKKNEEGN